MRGPPTSAASPRLRKTAALLALAALACSGGSGPVEQPVPGPPPAPPPPPAAPPPAAPPPSSPPAADEVPTERLERLARGINLGHWFATGGWRPEQRSESELRDLARIGFTHVRLPVRPDEIFDEEVPDRLGSPIADVDRALDRIAAAGLAAVVDLHPEENGFQERLESDPDFAGRFAEFWRALADHLSARDPDRLFLELLNEPDFRDPDRWNETLRALHAAVRDAAPEHTLIVSGPGCCSAEGLRELAPLEDPNVVYTAHFYEPAAFTHQGADWLSGVEGLHDLPYPSSPEACAEVLPRQPADQRAVAEDYCDDAWNAERVTRAVGRMAEWARTEAVPLYVGEFGALRDEARPEDRGRYLRDVRLALEAHDLGWAMWDYAGPFGLTVGRDGDRTIDPDVAEALGLPGS